MPLAVLEKEMAMAPLGLPKAIKVFNETGKEGHGFYQEDPEKFFGAVIEWVARHPKGCTDGPHPPPPPPKGPAPRARATSISALAGLGIGALLGAYVGDAHGLQGTVIGAMIGAIAGWILALLLW